MICANSKVKKTSESAQPFDPDAGSQQGRRWDLHSAHGGLPSWQSWSRRFAPLAIQSCLQYVVLSARKQALQLGASDGPSLFGTTCPQIHKRSLCLVAALDGPITGSIARHKEQNIRCVAIAG